MGYLTIKRIIDFLMALIGVVVLFPLFLIISVLIKIDSPGPVFFTQTRIGIHKKHFKIYKFRTMRIDTPKDSPTHLLDHPEYWITRVGRILRKTSLDEIPQIFNILNGEMSFVGPRPALWNQFDLVEEREKYGANDVPVGLTGWAQINGRDELDIYSKAKYDGEYVKNFGFLLDCHCIFKTFICVISSKGVVDGRVNHLHKSMIESDIHKADKS